MRMFLFVLLAFSASTVFAQDRAQQSTNPNDPQVQKNNDVVVLTGVATTARIADPNEPVVFNGRVMRMADFVAAVSSSNGAVQRLHNPEKQNHEKDQPVPPSKPKGSE